MSTRFVESKKAMDFNESPPGFTGELSWLHSFRADDVIHNMDQLGPMTDSICAVYYEYLEDMHDRWLVSHVLYEAISNAVKFSHPSNAPITVETSIEGHRFHLRVINQTTQSSWKDFSAHIQSLELTPLDEFFVKRIQSLASKKVTSGLGLILLKRNHRVEIEPRASIENGRYLAEIECTVLLNR